MMAAPTVAVHNAYTCVYSISLISDYSTEWLKQEMVEWQSAGVKIGKTWVQYLLALYS